MTSNIADTLTAMAARQPDNLAIIHPVARRQITYRELDDDSDCLARGFLAIGLTAGSRVAVMVRPGIDFFSIMFGLFKAGLVPVLIDPGIGLKPLRECLGRAEPGAFIGIPQAQAARLILGWAPHSIRTVITVGPRLFWGGWTLSGIRRRGAAQPRLNGEVSPEETAAILFTSGSTGVPKGAVYRHRNFLAQVEMIRATYGIEPGEIDLPTFAPFALFDPALGMTTIIPDMDFARPGSVDPAGLVSLMETYKVTNMFGSPAVMNRLAELGRPIPATLRRMLSAGAPVRPTILDGMKKILPSAVQVFTPYGATESLPVASIGSDEILGDTRARTDAGAGICVGRPVDHVSVTIIPISDEPVSRWATVRALPVGQVGEIVVRSPSVTVTYFRRDEATALAKIALPDGGVAHRMGDLGYFDDTGRLWYCGRKSHRVVTSDRTYFTEQVEGFLNAGETVRAGGIETALVGVTRHGSTEPVVCVAVRKKSVSADAEQVVGERARESALTAEIRQFLYFSDCFPVDIRHNAKIFRERLATWAAGKVR